jgi:hypothetical protein
MSEAHHREAAIFDATLEQPPDERSEYLDRTCRDEAALRQQLATAKQPKLSI